MQRTRRLTAMGAVAVIGGSAAAFAVGHGSKSTTLQPLHLAHPTQVRPPQLQGITIPRPQTVSVPSGVTG